MQVAAWSVPASAIPIHSANVDEPRLFVTPMERDVSGSEKPDFNYVLAIGRGQRADPRSSGLSMSNLPFRNVGFPTLRNALIDDGSNSLCGESSSLLMGQSRRTKTLATSSLTPIAAVMRQRADEHFVQACGNCSAIVQIRITS
jgi:hypothetical protein